MKLIILTLALAAAVFGAPSEEKRGKAKGCTPATYSCTPDNQGWRVCDTSGNWEYGGSCPPKTDCVFYPASQSPYCVPPGYQIP